MARGRGETGGGRPHAALPLRTVSRMTGLSPDLIRAWEKRYGVVRPLRGPRGARLYSEDDVRHLRLLAAVVAQGRAIGDVASLGAGELGELLGPPLESGGGEPAEDGGIAETLRDAVLRFDGEVLAEHLGESLFSLGGEAFLSRVAEPLLHWVGERWEAGEVSVAQEHMVSGALRDLLGSMLRARPPAHSPAVLLACPSGERHELGLMLAALALAHQRIRLIYLGADLPVTEIIGAARRTAPTAVGLSLVNQGAGAVRIEDVHRLRREIGGSVDLWLGGADAARVGEALGRDVAAVVGRLEEIPPLVVRLRATSGG